MDLEGIHRFEFNSNNLNMIFESEFYFPDNGNNYYKYNKVYSVNKRHTVKTEYKTIIHNEKYTLLEEYHILTNFINNKQ